MRHITCSGRLVTLLVWFSAVTITIVLSKPTLTHHSGNIDSRNRDPRAEAVSSNQQYSNSNPSPVHRQAGSGSGVSSRKEVLNEKSSAVTTARRRLKVPAKMFHLLSDYEAKRSGETKKVVSSSIVGLMQKSQTEEDEEMQSRRLKVSTSIYNWLVAHQNGLENISELPQNFPSLDDNVAPTYTPNYAITDKDHNSVLNPLYRCPIGNKTCQLQHLGL